MPNADGSVDIYIQNAPPAGNESNWLPAPPGTFKLWLRAYLPGPAILNGSVPGAARRGGELMPDITHKQWLMFALTVLVVVGIGTVAYIYYYPHLIYNAWDNAIVRNGDGATPDSTGIPVNTLYTLTTLASPSTHNNLAGRKPRHALHVRRA